jgi:toxin-antitoxin system PIN domain toxin
MILVDVNLLIYAVDKDAPLHAEAKSWWEATLSGTETVGLAWIVLLAFLRLTTRPNVFPKPLRIDAAFEIVDSWLAQAAVTVVHPGPRHARMLRDLLLPLGSGGNLTSDAHLAALALEHGAELCSSDHDFARFQHLKWHNPLDVKFCDRQSNNKRLQ